MSQVDKPKHRKVRKQTRLPHQRKQSRKGIKSHRGQPEIYDELKKVVSLSLTPTAVTKLDQLSQEIGISRSEFVERIARGEFQILLPEPVS